jgi:hypothetical protein
MSTLKVNDIVEATQGGGKIWPARAWITYAANTNTINADGNVSSVTDNGTGIYTINFSTSMTDANYSSNLSADGPVSTHHVHPYISSGNGQVGTYTSSAAQFSHFRDESSGNRADPTKACLQFVR